MNKGVNNGEWIGCWCMWFESTASTLTQCTCCVPFSFLCPFHGCGCSWLVGTCSDLVYFDNLLKRLTQCICCVLFSFVYSLHRLTQNHGVFLFLLFIHYIKITINCLLSSKINCIHNRGLHAVILSLFFVG